MLPAGEWQVRAVGRRRVGNETSKTKRQKERLVCERTRWWPARHSTHRTGGPTSSLGHVSMGTQHCAVVASSLKLKLVLQSSLSRFIQEA